MVAEKNTCSFQDRESDGRFSPGRSGNPSGRPRGSKNTSTKLREKLLEPILPEAIERLRKAVSKGEKWAVEMTISYCLPKPKPVDPDELAEFEERLIELEGAARRRQ